MASITVTPNPKGFAMIDKQLEQVPLVAAEAFAIALYTNLDSETHGRGEHWPDLPNRSSTPEQFPVKQTGQLQSEVEYGRVDKFRAFAGIVPKGEQRREIVRDLEYGNPEAALLQRAPIRRTGANRLTIEAMNKAVANAVGGVRK